MSVGASFEDLPEHHIVSIFEEEVNEKSELFVKIDSYIKETQGWKGEYATYEYDPKMKFDSSKLKGEVIREPLEHLPLFLFNSENIEDDMLEGEDLKDKEGS
nr:MAG TPA: hypothetical protein [Caudoviricetes sp.]